MSFFLRKQTVLAALRGVEKVKIGTKKNYQVGSFSENITFIGCHHHPFVFQGFQ